MVRQPVGIEGHPEQLRSPILRSRGATPTERLLVDLADATFLDLWSYPNPFRDQRISPNGEGKELCDLLVVCDPNLIIFSEKNIQWPERPIEVAWPRWYRKAVEAAADQLRGAERWISEHPDRVFLDRKCTIKLPLDLPPGERRRVHRVVVARGAAEASKRYFEGGTGSLVVAPSIRGQAHVESAAPEFMPFAIGDVDPNGDFVHVFDEASLEIVLRELDTIADFTRYLDKRSAFLRTGYLNLAAGEEDLLAYYAIRTNDTGEHDFTPPKGMSWSADAPISLDSSHFIGLTSEPSYKAKKQADQISYAWDRLIQAFTKHMLGGTSLVPPGREYSLAKSELGLRVMAQQTRFERRGLSEAWLDALKRGEGRDMFFRVVLTPPDKPKGTGFFFLTVKYADWMEEKGGYELYRLFRSGFAEIYAKALLMKHLELERVVGIATEPPDQGRGGSEDCLYGEQQDWTEEERAEVLQQCRDLGIMRSLKMTRFHQDEFPNLPSAKRHSSGPRYGGPGNRRQRRAAASARRGI